MRKGELLNCGGDQEYGERSCGDGRGLGERMEISEGVKLW